jgi:hypothetical protein
MSTDPVVSVIIPFLNAESFIHEAIESVFAQTYDNWELLLVDDGSSDQSSEIARRYINRSPIRVRYLEHENHTNRGISASRNLGISRARGEFVAFLDADDLWLPGKLERQMALMTKNSDVGLVFNRAFIWKDGIKTPQRMPLLPGRLPRGAWLITLLGRDGTDAFPSSVMVRRDAAVKVGGFGGSNLYEDQTTWMKFSLNSTVYYDEECVTLYRVHPASCCASATAHQHLLEQVSFYGWVVEYLKHNCRAFDSRLPTVMARCNLFTALLELANHSDNERSAAYRKNHLTLEAQSLGYLFRSLSALSTVSPQIAFTLTEGIFAFSRVTYSEGVGKAFQIIPRYLLKTVRGIVPQPIKRSIKQVLGFANGVKSQS